MDMQIIAYTAASITTLSFIIYVIRKAIASFKDLSNRLSTLETKLKIRQQFKIKEDCKVVTDSSKIISVEKGTKFSLKNPLKGYPIVEGTIFHDEVTIYIDIENIEEE